MLCSCVSDSSQPAALVYGSVGRASMKGYGIESLAGQFIYQRKRNFLVRVNCHVVLCMECLNSLITLAALPDVSFDF